MPLLKGSHERFLPAKRWMSQRHDLPQLVVGSILLLTGFHALDQWLSSLRANALGLESHERLKVRFEVGPCYVGPVLEQYDMCNGLGHDCRVPLR